MSISCRPCWGTSPTAGNGPKTVEPDCLRPISFLRLLASLSVVVEDDKFGPDLFRGELLEEGFVQLAGSKIPRSSMQVLPFPMSFIGG